jgi:hypothetical protein
MQLAVGIADCIIDPAMWAARVTTREHDIVESSVDSGSEMT